MRIKKFLVCSNIAFCLLFIGTAKAYCNFDVRWGNSDDNGLKGYQQIGQWFVENGYYEDLSTAEAFAKTGYLGYASNDPFYWNITSPFATEIVQEIAGNSNLNKLGYYTGGGHFKNMMQLFSGTENGPRTLAINQMFGLYLETPENIWYTDRGENDLQTGLLRESGGNAQSLIYELIPNTEWLIAWEDLDATLINSDRDFNDMYVKLTVVPEPVSSALFLLGGSMFVSRIRKKWKKN